MSTAQREHVVMRLQAKNAKSSHGKAVNLRNWRVANLALVETNVDIQQAMLDEFNNMAQQAINEHDEEPGVKTNQANALLVTH